MHPESNKALVLELADALLRSWWTIVAGVCLGLAGAVLALHQTPKEFRAQAKIMITPQQIDKQLIRSTVTEDPTRQLMALEEAVISEDYMRQLIDRTYGLPSDDEELRRLIRSVRGRVSVQPTATLQMGWLSFDLIFRDSDPKRAAHVINTLAELYIEQNRDARKTNARETTNTIEARLLEAKAAFEEKDRELNAFMSKHSFETESQLNANLRLLENNQRDLEYNQSNQVQTQERIQELTTDLEQLEAGEQTYAQRVQTLRKELDALLLNYSERHPAVIKKQRELDDLIASGGAEPVESEAVPLPQDPRAAALEQQLDHAKRELATLVSQADRLKREIREYQRRIKATPEVQPKLTALETERRILHQRYRDQEDKLEKALESQALEETGKATQLQLADRAEPPSTPIYPVPQRFYALGLAAGLLLFVGPLLLLRLMNQSISSESGLRSMTDVPVLVSIPRIPTPSYRGVGMRRLAKNLSLSVVCTAALVATMVFFR